VLGEQGAQKLQQFGWNIWDHDSGPRTPCRARKSGRCWATIR
jgi:hypothetical protein